MGPIVFVICAVLIMVLVVCSSGAIIYTYRTSYAHNARNPWCYKDWKCLTPNGEEKTMDVLSKVGENCKPLTIDEAAALGRAGKVNIYPKVQGAQPCTPSDHRGCLPYEAGDINWEKCAPQAQAV